MADVNVIPVSGTSVEKLEAWLGELARARTDDAGMAMVLNTGKSMLPALRRLGFIPDDPAELDVVLLALAKWALVTRSDDAWQPDTPRRPVPRPAGGPRCPVAPFNARTASSSSWPSWSAGSSR
jgi:hypothetical protein